MGDWGKHFLMRLSGLNRDFVCGRSQESLRPQGGRTEVAALGLMKLLLENRESENYPDLLED